MNDEITEELDRKDAFHLRLTNQADEDGDISKSTKNAIDAETDTMWEVGSFSRNQKDLSEYANGLLLRARRDAYVAKLNSRDILDLLDTTQGRYKEQLDRIENAVSPLKALVYFNCCAVVILAAWLYRHS